MSNKIFSKINGKIILCILLVILADFLFYQQPYGWTFSIFGFITLLSILLRNNKKLSDYSIFSKYIIVLTSLLLLSLTENLSPLSVCMSSLALITVALSDNKKWQNNSIEWLFRIQRFIIASPLRIFFDISKNKRFHRSTQNNRQVTIRNWLLPITFSIIFIFLFADANPIIDKYLKAIELSHLSDKISGERIFFWFLFTVLCWAIIRLKINTQKRKTNFLPIKTSTTLISYLFSEEAILRSLIIFNILFFAQNIMDIKYIWAGVKTPQGVSMAKYAHEGAYTLVITAILAAIFATISYKNNNNRLIKWLISIWITQNIFLVISSIDRTITYIDKYSLTYLRVAALIWMAIIALGLAYIILRILWNKSSLWLININIITVLSILYASCFVNFGYFIAQYNIQSSFDSPNKLDVYYLNNIGLSSLPAIKLAKEKVNYESLTFRKLENAEHALKYKLNRELSNWRSWTFRKYRISRGIK